MFSLQSMRSNIRNCLRDVSPSGIPPGGELNDGGFAEPPQGTKSRPPRQRETGRGKERGRAGEGMRKRGRAGGQPRMTAGLRYFL